MPEEFNSLAFRLIFEKLYYFGRTKLYHFSFVLFLVRIYAERLLFLVPIGLSGYSVHKVH